MKNTAAIEQASEMWLLTEEEVRAVSGGQCATTLFSHTDHNQRRSTMDKHPTTDRNCIPHWILVAAAIAIAAAGPTTFGASPTEAAVLSTGVPMSNGKEGQFFGGYTCADVKDGKNADSVPVQAFDCNAAPNQQVELSGQTIYLLGGQRCLDVVHSGTSPGTKVQSFNCNGSGAQKWTYEHGQIINVNSGLCLDAGDLANGRQLTIFPCNTLFSQQWQIK